MLFRSPPRVPPKSAAPTPSRSAATNTLLLNRTRRPLTSILALAPAPPPLLPRSPLPPPAIQRVAGQHLLLSRSYELEPSTRSPTANPRSRSRLYTEGGDGSIFALHGSGSGSGGGVGGATRRPTGPRRGVGSIRGPSVDVGVLHHRQARLGASDGSSSGPSSSWIKSREAHFIVDHPRLPTRSEVRWIPIIKQFRIRV